MIRLQLQTELAYDVLDDQGALRQHVAVFIDGRRCRDRQHQGDALRPDAVVHVLQALSGG